METSLAVRDHQAMIENPAGLGNKHAIEAIRKRIMTMMPGALEAPEDVVWAAAQLAVAYRLDPFNGEIFIMKIGSKKVDDKWLDDYRAYIGVKGLRKKAREQALFMTKFKDLTPEEVKAARRGDYDAGDVGVMCEVYRMDVAQQCQRFGIPYEPFRATGFWRVKAQFHTKNNKWMPDNIPNTWTAHDVAEKRAEVNALKRAYDLTIDVADPAAINDENTIEVIGRKVKEIEMLNAPVHRTEVQREDDGDVLFDVDAPAGHRSVDAETGEIYSDESAEDAPDALDILNDTGVHDAVKGFVETLRDLDELDAEPASPSQYQYAVGVIDGICGKDSHGTVFQAIFNRDVTKATPITVATAQRIFTKLCEKKTVKDEAGKPVKVENPDYDAQDVAILCEVGKWVKALEVPA